MRFRGTRRLRPIYVAGLVALGLLLSACTDRADQTTLKPKGPFARDIDRLLTPVFWIAVFVFEVVEGLILFAVMRCRERPGHERAPRQIHGNFRLEVFLTALPLMLLLGISVPTIATILDLSEKPAGNPLTVDVIGHQWWWEYRYHGSGVITATELHIPVGEPVYLRIMSADVIHSFWLPAFNGKKEAIPGRLQTMKIQADRPGTYPGQCTEFCGDSHANMRNDAVAQTKADFETWLADQQAGPPTPAAGTAAAAGLDLFSTKGCAG